MQPYFCPVNRKAALLLLLGLLGSAEGTTSAQRSTPLDPHSEQKIHLTLKSATLSGTLAAVMKQTHLAIVADGLPADKTADIDMEGSFPAVLDRVADAFDYTWRPGSGGVILMNKRFKDFRTAPQAHLKELRQVTNNILTVLQALNPNTNGEEWPEMEVSLAKTFTEEQTQVLLRGDRLPASALSPLQVQNLQTLIGNATFGDACDSWKEFLRVCNAMNRSELVLTAINGPIKAFSVHDPLSDINMPRCINIGASGFTKTKQ